MEPVRPELVVADAEQLRHFGVEKSASGSVRLNPFAIEHELRDGALAGVADHLIRRAGRSFDIDLFVGDRVLG